MPRVMTTGLAATALIFSLSVQSAQADGGFSLSSSAFADNALMPSRYAAMGGPRACDGEGISPPLAWSHAPEATTSFAIIVHDNTGAHGLGVTHWVGYGIPADVTGFDEGALNSVEGASFVPGTNRINQPTWFGPCPDVGDVAHHYEITIIATDLAPDALEAGMTRDALLAALAGRTLGATGLIGRYAR